MAEQIGRIAVPSVTVSGAFPLVPDYPWGRALAPEVYTHSFASGNGKIEQRFLAGMGAKRFTMRRQKMSRADVNALANFWRTNQGTVGAFTYHCPTEASGTEDYTCRFADPSLSFDAMAGDVFRGGVMLLEVPDPAAALTYALNSTDTRMPSAALQAALLSQVQEIIPLVHIKVASDPTVPDIYISDRRCTIGGQLYLPRLLRFDNVQQTLGVAPDAASFTFGDADRVMTKLVNDCEMRLARLEFSLFHVGTGIKIDLWAGDIQRWSCNVASGELTFEAGDPLAAVNRYYPMREVSRTCNKPFKDGLLCPYAGAATSCDRAFATCRLLGMADYFGGILATPQGVTIRNNETKQQITSFSLISDSIYGKAVPEIYTGHNLAIDCLIAAGREESEFYDALGVIGEGPLQAVSGGLLDGQPNHGPGALGLRICAGGDGKSNTEPFCLGHGSPQVWDGPERAAGTAFIEIRRSDPAGIQLAALDTHVMKAYVPGGLGGWYWNTSTDRVWGAPLTNPVWIAVNMWLRYKNIQFADAATQKQYFDVEAAMVAAQVCASRVTPIITPQAPEVDGLETQYDFNGILADAKPLRDWLSEVLMTCLGFYTWSFGKLQIGCRNHSGSTDAYGAGNIITDSLELLPIEPGFNHLTATFYDREYQTTNSVVFYDSDHVAKYSQMRSTMNLVGVSKKSQAARLLTIRLREELGGVDATEQRKARAVRFRTTILGLTTAPGVVGSITHDDAPGGAIEFRCSAWRLNPDYSIDVEGQTTTDAMYDLASGPRPADVPAEPPPGDTAASAQPGDVQSFEVVQSNLSDGSRAFDVKYDPPNPIGSFSGVYGVFEMPDGCGVFTYTPDQAYNGDPNGNATTRKGTCRFVMPAPATTEQWFLAVASCAPTFRKNFVPDGDPAETPNAVLTVDAATAPSGGEVDLTDVTNVVVGSPTPVIHEEVLKALVRVDYKTPVHLGAGDAEVKLIQVHVKSRTGIERLQAFPLTVGAGQDTYLELYLAYPPGNAEDDYDVYLCSKSDRYEDPLVLRDAGAAASPYGTVHMPANPSTWNAPDVLAFQAGYLTGGAFDTAPHWEAPLNKRMLIDWGCMLPSDITNWSKVAIFIKTPAPCIQATGLLDLDTFTPADGGGLVHYDCIAIEGADLPDDPETWQIIACSYNRAGLPNHDINGLPTGPYRTLQTLSKATVPNFETPGNVTGLAVDASHMTGLNRELRVTYTPPVSVPSQGVQFYLERPAGSTPIALASVDGDGTTNQQSTTLYEAAPPDADVSCKLWAVSYSPTVAARLITTGGNTSASVTFTLPRCPLVAQPTGVSASVTLGTDEGKNPIWSVSGSWNGFTDPLFEAVAVDCVWSGGAITPLGAWKGTAADPFVAGPWPVSTPDTCTLKFYSVNSLGVRNTTNPATVGPLTVDRQAGSGGQENCPFVAAFTASAEFDHGTGPDGVERWRLKWSVTGPSDKRYAGYKIVLRPASGGGDPLKDATIEPAGDQVAGDWWVIGAQETYTAYCVSRDAAGRYNTITASTPKVPGILVQAQTTGKLPAGRLTGLGSGLGTSGGNLVVKVDPGILGFDGQGQIIQTAVDIGKAKTGTYDPDVFKVDTDNKWKLKTAGYQFTKNSTDGLILAALDAGVIKTGSLYVASDKVPEIVVQRALGGGTYENVAWVGYNVIGGPGFGYIGGWFKNLWVGGTDPTTSPFRVDASGNLILQSSGANSLLLNIVRTHLNVNGSNPYYGHHTDNWITGSDGSPYGSSGDAAYEGAIGWYIGRRNTVESGYHYSYEPYAWYVSRGLVVHRGDGGSGSQILAAVAVREGAEGSSLWHGEMLCYDSAGVEAIHLNGLDGSIQCRSLTLNGVPVVAGGSDLTMVSAYSSNTFYQDGSAQKPMVTITIPTSGTYMVVLEGYLNLQLNPLAWGIYSNYGGWKRTWIAGGPGEPVSSQPLTTVLFLSVIAGEQLSASLSGSSAGTGQYFASPTLTAVRLKA